MGQDQNNQYFDFIICGAGLYGLYLANLLCKAHKKVLVLTANTLNRDNDIWTYETNDNFKWERYRKLGGKSLEWGGNLSLLGGNDLKSIPYQFSSKNINEVLKNLGIKNSDNLALKKEYGRRVQTMKNGLSFLSSYMEIKSDEYIHKLHFEKRSVKAVEVINFTSNEKNFYYGSHFILACSPFENSTILLNSQQSFFPKSIGEYFNDHLFASYLVLVKKNTFSSRNDFKYEKGILTEVTGPYSLDDLNSEELAQMGVSLNEKNKYQFFTFHGFHQTDDLQNRTLKLGRKNHLGCLRPIIDWVISDQDYEFMDKLEKNLENDLYILFPESKNIQVFQTHEAQTMQGIPHETGGCLWGKVVNKNHLLLGSENLYIADASIFPNSLEGYPSLTTLVCINFLGKYLKAL